VGTDVIFGDASVSAKDAFASTRDVQLPSSALLFQAVSLA
jgi:hypothetical protein